MMEAICVSKNVGNDLQHHKPEQNQNLPHSQNLKFQSTDTFIIIIIIFTIFVFDLLKHVISWQGHGMVSFLILFVRISSDVSQTQK